MTRQERYKLMLKAKEEGEKKVGGDFPKEEHPEYCVSDKGTPMLFRPMTFGSVLDPKTGHDHRLFYYSFMKDDSGAYFPWKWGFEEWYKHPLYKLVKKVAKYSFDDSKPRGQQKVYENEGCELLLDIIKNGDASNTLSNGWQPTKTLLMNVIDRMDSWCKDNKHSKVLTYKAEHDEESDRWKTDYGMKSSQYDEMFRLAEEEMGSIIDFDFLTVKYKTAKDVGQGKKEYYKTLLAEAKKPYIEDHYGEEFVSAIFEDYDEEEMAYEMYDFDSMPLYQASSMGYFMSKKGDFVKAVDEKYSTNFYAEFMEIVEKEKAERGETTSTTTEETKSEVKEEKAPEVKSEEKPVSRRSAKVEEEKSESKEFDPRDLDPEVFKGIRSLPDSALELIIGVTEDNKLVFKDGLALDSCEKEFCQEPFPLDGFNFCPYCNTEYA